MCPEETSEVMLAQSGGSEMQLAQAHNAKARAEERWQAQYTRARAGKPEL